MAAAKMIVLITGANGGIGFELASQLLADQTKHVLLGSRSIEKGEAAVKDLQSHNQPGSVELLQIDVSSDDSITAAAKKVESSHGRLDTLINNAAIGFPPGEKMSEQMAAAFQTNATGPYLVGEAFAPLLEKSTGTPRIINVSSGGGSIERRMDPSSPMYKFKGAFYNCSKAAMNMVTACQVAENDGKGFKVFSFCPGFTVSNLSHMNKAENGAKPTSEGAAPIVKVVNGERDAESGKFLHANGQYPW